MICRNTDEYIGMIKSDTNESKIKNTERQTLIT